QQSENRFKELFNNMSSGVAIYEAKDHGQDFIIKDFNCAGEMIDKIKKEDIIGKSVLKVFPGIKDFGLFQVFQEVYQTGKPQSHPISFYQDQRIFGWRENYIYKLSSGEIVAVYDDITERKQMEEELLKNKALLTNAEEIGKVGGWEFNVETLTQTWTDETFRILEIDMSKGEPKVPEGLEFITPQFRSMAEQAIQRAIKYGEPYDQEWEVITMKGNKRWVHSVAKAKQKEGKIISVLGSFQDITEQKQAEERLKKTMDATLETMSKIVEAKDPYTAGHQLRVSQLAVAIAVELNLPQDQLEGVRVSSLIHDIGKIGLPTETLSKPTHLTEIEFNLIKEHSQLGYDILKSIDFAYPVAQIVLEHHERLNGSGYPHQLKGDQILLEARILGVADVVEAMSSHRPYRPALGIDKALEEITRNKETLYDPKAVDVCLRLFKEKGFEFE
ncbi:MAG TPA: HD domain-containing protein, partial [Candidatus Atribacteria bacterium]|nr:HD domain-containing protein [Candidatus Atribacteria bacterium]